jgi:hypothetical protein
MNRPPWIWLTACLALLALTACSDDDNEPPSARIAYPEDGAVYTSSPDSVVVDARDDSGVTRVEITLDGAVLSVDREAPFSTRLPLGRYADGQPHTLGARAFDSSAAEGVAPAVTVTIDPALQTIPQIVSLAPDDAISEQLRLSWLRFPGPISRYEWQVAASDAFADTVATGTTSDTTAVLPGSVSDLAYARVRAVLPARTTDWSRMARHSGVATGRTRYLLPGSQLARRIFEAGDDTLRLLSHGATDHRSRGIATEWLVLDRTGRLVAASRLLPPGDQVLASVQSPDGDLVLAGLRADGPGFVLRASMAGDVTAEQSTDLLEPMALAVRGGQVLALGADPSGVGGIVARVGADAGLTAQGTFPLEAGRDVRQAWPRADGGWTLAGQLPKIQPDPDEPARYPGGFYARGLAPDGSEEWSLRLGSAHRWLLRGAGADLAGERFVLAGMAVRENPDARYGFLASFAADGRLLWTVTDRNWRYFADVAPAAAGRWAATGVSRRQVGDDRSEDHHGLRGLSPYGASLWEVRHARGTESMGWSLLAHPDGGWWSAGAVTDDGEDFDVDLLRTDDRGALDTSR